MSKPNALLLMTRTLLVIVQERVEERVKVLHPQQLGQGKAWESMRQLCKLLILFITLHLRFQEIWVCTKTRKLAVEAVLATLAAVLKVKFKACRRVK